METTIIFGAPDFEESVARKLASEIGGIHTATATINGRYVYTKTAYAADGFTLDKSGRLSKRDIDNALIFECAQNAAGIIPVSKCFDHHNPGDPGYDKGPDQFWEGSSLGQMCNHFNITPTERLKFVAASDHCPAEAYKGLCTDIDPDEFAAWRMDQKIQFYKKDPRTKWKADKAILGELYQTATNILKKAPRFGDTIIRDLYKSSPVDELREAANISGEAYVATVPEFDRNRAPTGNEKVVLNGHATPSLVKAFMKWAASFPNKIDEPYGNPYRGFAGVVIGSN